jgi:5-methylthioribose kinase
VDIHKPNDSDLSRPGTSIVSQFSFDSCPSSLALGEISAPLPAPKRHIGIGKLQEIGTSTMNLESLRYKRGELSVLDQLLLPTRTEYVDVLTKEDAWNVIRKMQVRGAPLIAIVAALGIAVAANSERESLKTVQEASKFLIDAMEYLRTSRPTAVNLFIATDALKAQVEKLTTAPGASSNSVLDGYIAAAEQMLVDDIAANKSMGEHGAKRILELAGKDKVKVLTICNTGSLATAGYGTALGVVRALHTMGKLEQVFACETRPYNQGARLTAYEIVAENMPGTLITDSMASYLMATKGIDCVLVGADRIAANGDTANKIGTYMLAIAAKHHGVPFFPVAPSTTVDVSMANGSTIPVECRPDVELLTQFGQRLAPEGISAWNPAFDVTPCSLISGIITEVGVAVSNPNKNIDGIIDMPQFFKDKGLSSICSGAAEPSAVPSGYKALSTDTVADYCCKLKNVRAALGLGDLSAAEAASKVSVDEVGDGNLNFVYIVRGPGGLGGNAHAVVLKQALPFVRCVGESWPLSIDRATFEHNALVEQRNLCPENVPSIFHFNKSMALIIMEYVKPPHLILRKHFIAGTKLSFAKDIGHFCATTLFGTSNLALSAVAFRNKVSEWSQNTDLCALTEQVVFTDPYYDAPMNRHTSPQLDAFALAIRADVDVKVAAQKLKAKFLGSCQSLLHGDLHSGSVMSSEAGTNFVIDPEFAFYGPMGFDTGAFLANLFLAYFSQKGQGAGRDDYAAWLLEQTALFYSSFAAEFVELWNSASRKRSAGEAFLPGPFPSDSAELKAGQEEFMRALWKDTVGFAGMKMTRRIVGIAHVADLDDIEDVDVRSQCEKRALKMAKAMILSADTADSLEDVDALLRLAQGINQEATPDRY